MGSDWISRTRAKEDDTVGLGGVGRKTGRFSGSVVWQPNKSSDPQHAAKQSRCTVLKRLCKKRKERKQVRDWIILDPH